MVLHLRGFFVPSHDFAGTVPPCNMDACPVVSPEWSEMEPKTSDPGFDSVSAGVFLRNTVESFPQTFGIWLWCEERIRPKHVGVCVTLTACSYLITRLRSLESRQLVSTLRCGDCRPGDESCFEMISCFEAAHELASLA